MGSSFRPENPFVPNLGGSDAPLEGTPQPGADYRPENPFAGPAKGTGVVTAGPIKPLGISAEDIARQASTGPLNQRIAANIQIARDPDMARAVRPIAARMQAPGTLETAANIATGNLIAPFSDRAANAATQHDLNAYAEGGGDVSGHANLFGAASALGAVAGNVGLAKASTPGAVTGARAAATVPVAKTALGRIGQSALSAGLTNATIGAGGEAAFGDENGQRNLGDVVRTGLEQGVVGAGLGAGMGALAEGAGALARKFRPENPFVSPNENPQSGVPGRVLAERNAEPQPIEGAQQNARDIGMGMADSVATRGIHNALDGTRVVGPDGQPRVVYHGTNASFTDFDPSKLDPKALYGPGYYFTEEPSVAGGDGATTSGYAGKGPSGSAPILNSGATLADVKHRLDSYTQALNEIRAGASYPRLSQQQAEDAVRSAQADYDALASRAPQIRPARLGIKRPFDIDRPLDDDNTAEHVLSVAQQRFPNHDWDYTRELLDQNADDHNIDGGDLHQAISGTTDENGAKIGKAATNEILRAAGYDGITHVGGSRTGTPSHQVWIAFDRPQIRSAFGPPNTAGQVGAIDPALLAKGGGAAIGGVAGAGYGATQGDTKTDRLKNALIYGAGGAALGYGAGSLAMNPGAVRQAYRSAMVTPYAEIEKVHPELTEALNKAGAAPAYASHIATTGVNRVLGPLDPDQQSAFTHVLLRDTEQAKAQSAASRGDAAAAHRFNVRAQAYDQNVPQGTEQEQWFKDALDRHKQSVGGPLEDAAQRAGVSSILQPQSAYLRGDPFNVMLRQERNRAVSRLGVDNADEITARGPITRALIGEKKDVQRLGDMTGSVPPPQPTATQPPVVGRGAPPRSKGASLTGSSKAAQGTADSYVTDYRTLVTRDAEDKITRGATNDAYGELARAGFKQLPADRDPAEGMAVLERKVPDPNNPGSQHVERWEVTPQVKNAIDHFEAKKGVTDQSGLWRGLSSGAVRAQISGMPVEATSHANTLTSQVASVPGEADVAGKVTAAFPGVGGKVAAMREMMGVDFSDPKTQALQDRLAKIGALRVEGQPQGGLMNTSHHWLFGDTGVDPRGRLVLARKYLDRKPDASDGELREFITSKLGNYNRANSGTLVNGLQDAGVSSFARFQAARIPSSIRSTFGFSGLPSTTTGQKVGDIAKTLYRGPVGYGIAGQAANYAMTGHGMQDNEHGHQMDVQLPFTVGSHNRPAYVPLAFTNPAVATGLRATGIRDMIPMTGAPSSFGGKVADAMRDVVNTGMGVASPAVRGVSIAATGRTPYLLDDGTMLRVSDPKFNRGTQALGNIKSAFSLANPAASAFAEQGGDLTGHRLSDALEEDGKAGGGPKAIAAKAAEFLFPRVATLGTGGKDNQLSADNRQKYDYQAAMKGYQARLQNAKGPIGENRVINEARADAKSGGYDPDVVEDELRSFLDRPDRTDSRERSTEKWTDTHVIRP